MSNRKKVRRLVGLTTLNLIFLAICIVTLVPILYAVTLSLSGSGGALSSGLTFIPETPTLDNYRAILLEEPFLLWLKNSAILSVGTMVVAMGTADSGICIFKISISRKKGCPADVTYFKCVPANIIYVCDFSVVPYVSSAEFVYWIDNCLRRKHVYFQYLEYERIF